MVAFALLTALAYAAPAHAQQELWSPEPDLDARPAPGPSHRVRHLFAPSAFMLEEDEGYASQKQLLLTQVEYGVTDWFSVSASGVIPFWIPPTSSLLLNSGWLLNVLVGVKLGGHLFGDLHASFGASLTSVLSVTDFGVLAVTGQFFEPFIPLPALLSPYGHLTYGTPDAHLTAGFTAPLAAVEAGGDRMIIPHFAGYVRATDWLGFSAEYWIYDNQVSPERRFRIADVSDANFHVFGMITRLDLTPFTVDLGAVFLPTLTPDRIQLRGLPWLEVSWDFGR
jgi:hypothetical protein